MNNKFFYYISISSIVMIFIFCIHAGAFAGKKHLQYCSYDQYFDGVSTYYSMTSSNQIRFLY